MHRFYHTFVDGSRITLTMDVSTVPPTFTAVPQLQPHQTEEYRQWLIAITPDITALCDPRQLKACAEIGRHKLSKGA